MKVVSIEPCFVTDSIGAAMKRLPVEETDLAARAEKIMEIAGARAMPSVAPGSIKKEPAPDVIRSGSINPWRKAEPKTAVRPTAWQNPQTDRADLWMKKTGGAAWRSNNFLPHE